jgi:hypothetical protein
MMYFNLGFVALYIIVTTVSENLFIFNWANLI